MGGFGVPKLPERRSWQTWLEGKGPDFVLEITSKSTKREDEVRKKKLYEELGVKEYWQFDPTGDYLDPILKGENLGRTASTATWCSKGETARFATRVSWVSSCAWRESDCITSTP